MELCPYVEQLRLKLQHQKHSKYLHISWDLQGHGSELYQSMRSDHWVCRDSLQYKLLLRSLRLLSPSQFGNRQCCSRLLSAQMCNSRTPVWCSWSRTDCEWDGCLGGCSWRLCRLSQWSTAGSQRGLCLCCCIQSWTPWFYVIRRSSSNRGQWIGRRRCCPDCRSQYTLQRNLVTFTVLALI